MAWDDTGRLVSHGSYTDDRGVHHEIDVDERGQVIRDQFTADGTAYDRRAVYENKLVDRSSGYFSRANDLYRIAYTTVNGVQLGSTIGWDPLGRLLDEHTAAGAPHSNSAILDTSYDANGYLRLLGDTSFTYSNVDAYRFQRDANHRLASLDYIFPYDGSIVGPSFGFTWQNNGLLATLTTHGVTTTYGYDSAGNVISTSDSIGRVESIGRNAAGDITSYNDGTAAVAYGYDAADRLTSIQDGAGNVTTLTYQQPGCGCSQDNLVSTIHTPDLPSGSAWQFDYDADSNLSQVTDPTGNAEQYTYTQSFDLSTVTDRNQHTTSFTYDQLGRPVSVVDPHGRVGTYSYPVPSSGQWVGPAVYAGSPDGTLPPTALGAALRDGEYQVGANGYTPGGFPAQIQLYRDATFELSFGFYFDSYQRTVYRRDRTGLAIDSTQPYGSGPFRLSSTTSYGLHTAAPVVSLISSSPYQTNYSEESQLGRNTNFDLVSALGWEQKHPYQNQTYNRDVAGRILSIDTSFSAPSLPSPYPSFHESVTWDASNQRRITQLVGGAGTQDITYNARGDVASVQLSFDYIDPVTFGVDTTTEGTFSYDGYDAMGRNTHLVYPDGHIRRQTWDELGRLTSRCYDYAAGTRCYTAQYDPAGNPIVLTDPERSCNIAYDDLDRITDVSCDDGSDGGYTYNALGALSEDAGETLEATRPRLDGSGTASSGVPATYGGQPVTLDPVGQVTSLQGTTLGWNGRGILVTATDGTTSDEYGYDAFLRRIARVRTTGTTTAREYYIYDVPPTDGYLSASNTLPTANNITAVLDAPGVAGIQRRYLYDGVDQPLWMYDAALEATLYFELDTLGNVRRLRGGRRLDPSKSALPSDLGGYTYTAFGRLLPADSGTPAPAIDGQPFDQPLRWQGRWYTSLAGGLYDFRARQWSPALGTFLTADRFGFLTRTGTLWSWPGESPTGLADPTGRTNARIDELFNWATSGNFGGGIAAFARGVEQRRQGINELADPATTGQGLRDVECGSASIAGSAGQIFANGNTVLGAVGVVQGVAELTTRVHLNSNASPALNHVYRIYQKSSGETYKYGISGVPLVGSKSLRAALQTRWLGSDYSYEIVAMAQGRANAAWAERWLVTAGRLNGEALPGNIRPTPWPFLP